MSVAVDEDTFREGMSRLAGAVSVVATGSGAGDLANRRGMTATAVCSVSAQPPSLLVCLHHDAGTLALVRRVGAFSVNVLTDQHLDVAWTFAGADRYGADRFAVGTWESRCLGIPVLADALVVFECRVAQTYRHSTHALVIGNVESVRWAPAAKPLVFHARRFVGLGEVPAARSA